MARMPQNLVNSIPPAATSTFKDGEAAFRAGQLNEAIKHFRESVKLAPSFHLAIHKLANALQHNGQTAESFDYRLKTIEANPGFDNPYKRLWGLELSDDQLDRAIKCCRTAFKRYRDLTLIPTTLGNLLTQRGDLDQAITAYQTASYMQTLISNPEFTKNHWSNGECNGPDFFVIGGMKCGSTSIFSYISQHPNVIAPLKKEFQFFNQFYDNGLEWYLAHFPSIPADQPFVTGEATPCLGEFDVWTRIKKHFPNKKFIVLLRDPVKRAYSHFHHNKVMYGTNEDLNETIAEDLGNSNIRNRMLNNPNAYRHVQSHYLLLGLYVHWLRDWFKHFDREQFLVLPSEDLYTQPDTTMRRVFKFLELPANENIDFKRQNSGHYSFAPIDPEMKANLLDYYQPHNEALSELLGIEFNWDAPEKKRTWKDRLFRRPRKAA